MEIFPSVLEYKIDEFWRQLENLTSFFSYFQIDITDGKLVNNKTIQIDDILKTVTTKRETVNRFSCEFHLMIEDYEAELKKLEKLSASLNIKYILIHLKALKKGGRRYPMIIAVSRPQFGIVLSPDESIEENWVTIQKFPLLQLMSVYPGAQGTPFVPEVLTKITQLRQKGYTGKIELDGAVNDKTMSLILQNKFLPDAVCPGSYIKVDTVDRLRILQEMIKAKK